MLVSKAEMKIERWSCAIPQQSQPMKNATGKSESLHITGA
jgi:hypothetical protein